MQDFDGALKELFQSLGPTLIERLAGAPAREWLNVELPKTGARRVDLVAWLANGELFHLEFQSRNDEKMPLRMLEYFTLLLKQFLYFDRYVQILAPEMNMFDDDRLDVIPEFSLLESEFKDLLEGEVENKTIH